MIAKDATVLDSVMKVVASVKGIKGASPFYAEVAVDPSEVGPHIVRNLFTGSEFGVSGSDNAVFMLERNRFEDNRMAVVVSSGSDPSVLPIILASREWHHGYQCVRPTMVR